MSADSYLKIKQEWHEVHTRHDAAHRHKAVSYTHLDVYKRQDPVRMSPAMICHTLSERKRIFFSSFREINAF